MPKTVSSLNTSPHAWDPGLDDPIDLGPLVDVLFTHYVGVDEKVSVTHTEMLLTGGALETLQVIHFVFHTHCHLIGTDPLVTRRAETILTKKPRAKRKERKKKPAKRQGQRQQKDGSDRLM